MQKPPPTGKIPIYCPGEFPRQGQFNTHHRFPYIPGGVPELLERDIFKTIVPFNPTGLMHLKPL